MHPLIHPFLWLLRDPSTEVVVVLHTFENRADANLLIHPWRRWRLAAGPLCDVICRSAQEKVPMLDLRGAQQVSFVRQNNLLCTAALEHLLLVSNTENGSGSGTILHF